jgi:hypothetical protein
LAARTNGTIQLDHAALRPEVRSAHWQMEPSSGDEDRGLHGHHGAIIRQASVAEVVSRAGSGAALLCSAMLARTCDLRVSRVGSMAAVSTPQEARTSPCLSFEVQPPTKELLSIRHQLPGRYTMLELSDQAASARWRCRMGIAIKLPRIIEMPPIVRASVKLPVNSRTKPKK